MDVAMKEQLVAAGMPAAQAEVLASHMPEWPDWSQLATKADLQELAGQMATKADLKDLDQKSQSQMLDLKAQMQDLKTDLKDQMLDLKADLQGQIAAMKSSLAWQLWLPVAVIVITILADRFTKVTPS